MNYKPNWSKKSFYGNAAIFCKHCGNIAEEDINYAAISTGRRFRCKKCKTEASFDETTEIHYPDRWKVFTDNFLYKYERQIRSKAADDMFI